MMAFIDPVWESLYAGMGLLLDATLKGSLILLFAGALSVIARGLSAAVRHLVWSLALSSFLVLPLLSVVLPAIQLPVLPDSSLFQREAAMPVRRDTVISVSTMQPVETGEQENTGGLTENRVPEPVDARSRPVGDDKDRAASAPGFASLASFPWFVWAMLVWATGAIYVISRLLFEIIIIMRLTRRGKIVTDREWTRELERCRERLNLDRPVQLVESDQVSMPVTWGFHSPVILIPTESAEWPQERRRVVLLHECAHVKRGDYLHNLICQLVCALNWFNPLVWIAARRVLTESEKACDDCVINSGVEATSYAGHLLEIASALNCRGRVAITALGMAGRTGLRSRLLAILNQNSSRQALTRRVLSITTLSVITALVPLAAVKFSEQNTSSAIAPTIAALSDERSEIRKRAAWQLGEREDPLAVEALIKSLRDADPEMRAMSAWALGEIKDRRAVGPLLAALIDDDVYSREMIVLALGEIEDAIAIAALVDRLQDASQDVRSATVWALGEIARRARSERATEHHNRALNSIAAALRDSSAQVRETSAQVLGDVLESGEAPTAFESLLDSLRDGDQNVRTSVIRALGEIEDPRAIESLITILRDESPHLKREAARALGEIGDSRAVSALIAALRDQNREVRAMAIWALDEVSAP
ncbi:MAG: M56 family metallopeptidase [Blastocatellia bacterium]|nr:M56 family metallopeptidase [Blastocatellia bacterium]